MKRLLLLILCATMAVSSATRKRSSGTTEHVREYTRKDGTVVQAHERKKPESMPKPVTAKKAEPRTVTPPAARATGNYCASCERDAKGREIRSAAAKRAFRRERPCPGTGSSTGSCDGYVIDHVKPLACGGADSPSNMAWQTVAEAKAKDKIERKGCGI